MGETGALCWRDDRNRRGKVEEHGQSEENPVSTQKVGANHRNRLKSTRPRAPWGEANVRFNAVKHGFFSKQIVLSSKAIGEDPEEFEALLKKLRQHLSTGRHRRGVAGGNHCRLPLAGAAGLRCELGEVGHARVEKRERSWIFHKITDSEDGPGRVLQILKRADAELKKVGMLSSGTRSALSKVFGWEELDEKTLENIRTGQEKDVKRIGQWQKHLVKRSDR
jgi:hypothetical protein